MGTLRKHGTAGAVFAALLAGIVGVSPTFAAEPAGKPKMVTISTFDVGSSGYAEMSAVNDAVFKTFDVKVRNVPIGNSVAQLTATRSGTTQLWQSCSAHYPAFEGIQDYGTAQWGPQSLRIVYMSNRVANFSPAATKSSGVTKLADIKGKRLAWIIGDAAINMQTEAYLAFAGLTLKDVRLVEFPGYTASLRGMISGQVDVALAASSSTGTYEVEASPVGLVWLPVPHADAEGWARIQDTAPFVAPVDVTSGAGIAKGETLEGGTYPCPVIMAYAKQSADLVYWYTKMVVESWESYRDTTASGAYWQIDRALKGRQVEPWHEGAVRYFKEIGKWTPELEARQQYLLKRDAVLAAGWEAAKTSFAATGKDAKEFPAYWSEQRTAALKAAGLPLF